MNPLKRKRAYRAEIAENRKSQEAVQENKPAVEEKKLTTEVLTEQPKTEVLAEQTKIEATTELVINENTENKVTKKKKTVNDPV